MEFLNIVRDALLDKTWIDELMKKEIGQPDKNSELSTKARELGNKLYRTTGHDDLIHCRILEYYSEALAMAPNNSTELALAYGNKSSLLLHLGKFEDAIKDIDRSLKINTLISAHKIKLLCRKVECLVAVGKTEEGQEVLHEVKRYFEETGSVDEQALKQFISRAEAASTKGLLEVESYDTRHLQERYSKESKGMFDTISLKHDSKCGQHFIAKTDIQPGELLFICKPYTMVPNFDKPYLQCAHCLDLLWSSVPCENCNYSLYCSEKCRDEALRDYHDVECRCLQFVLAEGTMNYLIHVAMRSVIKAVKEFGSIEALMEEDRQAKDLRGK